MPRITALTSEQASPVALKLLQSAKAKIGMVPNLFSTLAHAPAALAGYLQLDENLKTGALSAAQREIISLAIGQFNQCGYCLSAHTLMGKGAGLSPDAIAAARLGSGSAVAELAVQVAQTRGNVSDADLSAARAAGLSDEQIIEVVASVALNVLTNYVNNLAETVIDFPKVSV
ncbi:carboxymuconolactone decarboxylase family protein [Paraburkholderia phytofirmans]|uniref:Peroxidase-related enzyme n=1 Tax=Paraburkholderia phytofirmans TaxID=261302 RepID=A0ABW9BNB7_9BURK